MNDLLAILKCSCWSYLGVVKSITRKTTLHDQLFQPNADQTISIGETKLQCRLIQNLITITHHTTDFFFYVTMYNFM
jgi:hypothetical protein